MPLFCRIGPILVTACFISAAAAQTGRPAASDALANTQPELQPQALTQAPQGGRAVWSLYWENDGAIKPNHETDRHYTNGARIVMSAQHQWADDLARWMPLAPAQGDDLGVAAFYSVAQLIFTPDNIEKPAARRPDDRGYAGWLYFSVGLERASESIADRVDLKLGVIGPSSLAEQAQQNVHDIFDPNREPIGWDDQLDDRFAIDLDVNRRWKFNIDNDDTDNVDIEFIPEMGFTVGTVHDHLMVGATLRIGSPFLPSDFGAGRLEAPTTALAYPSGEADANENLSWSLYGRVEGRAVLRNDLLKSVDPEDFFGSVQVGVTFLIANNLTIGYSQTWFSQEYKTQIANDSIAAVTVTWSYAY